jgi:uncharacterized membrane protein YbaN (DUF454 family)
MKKWLRVVLGCAALAIGVVGLITPFLPGWVFLGIGMLLLSHMVPAFDRWLGHLEARIPSCRPHLHRVRQWLD